MDRMVDHFVDVLGIQPFVARELIGIDNLSLFDVPTDFVLKCQPSLIWDNFDADLTWLIFRDPL